MKVSSLATIASLWTLSVGHAATVQANDSGIVHFPPLPGDTTTTTAVRPTTTNQSIALNFAPVPPPVPPVPAPSIPHSRPATTPNRPARYTTADLFARGSGSLVARTVGHAEGTRTVSGGQTRAYYGHTDPGNGVWNLGSFSFQHCREYHCSTPAEADAHQLKRLSKQAEQLVQRATALGIDMTLLEELNGIDLANQAPLAALGEPGYTDWLKTARTRQLDEVEGVLWARVQSFWDPQLNDWNAPGLGNREDQIRHDQNRRLTAIARALAIYHQQTATHQPHTIAPSENLAPDAEAIADRIIWHNLED